VGIKQLLLSKVKQKGKLIDRSEGNGIDVEVYEV
jgi:hypothetical protein